MHEFSLVKKEVERLREKVNGKKVSKVVFSLGRLAHGTPDSIRKAFEVATLDTSLSGAELDVLSIDPKVKCLTCGYSYSVEQDIKLACPECGSESNELVAGKECFVNSVEIED